jgi:NAD(P)-dependent dehydrogenase (short-subunit alcohol dehydrogenase family)
MMGNSDLPFRGRAAIVTGAASGIGRAVALRLHSGGAAVFAADINPAALSHTSAPGTSSPFRSGVVDVADVASIQEMTAQAVREFGRLDMLVNAAGVMQTILFENITVADWDRVLDINLRGTFFCIQAAAPHLADGGVVLNFSSIAGRSGRPFAPHYASSKMGVISLTRSCALALAPKIRVNAICPGVVDTPMWDQIDRDRAKLFGHRVGAAREEAIQSIPLGRTCGPDEIAAVAAFLLSDAAGYMTGQAINVDGGVEMD